MYRLDKLVGIPIYDNVVYKLQNTVTGYFYIGQTMYPRTRLRAHAASLARGVHTRPKIQVDYNLYGEASFVVELLVKRIPINNLREVERMYLDKYAHNPLCYNNYYNSPWNGVQTKQNISKEELLHNLRQYQLTSNKEWY
jgi:GIY-YIG catalytic domain-containing protein